MAARKVLTRAESQALTREELIEAAERLFYANGYHATSLAAIAAEAGRTIGAVYSNFDRKEDLGLEVLRGWGSQKLSRLATAIASTDGSLEQRLAAVANWWDTQLIAENDALILAAEFGISVVRDRDQRAAAVEACQRFVEAGRVLLLDHLPEGATHSQEVLEDAVQGVLGTAIGLAVGHMTEMTPNDRSTSVLIATVEFWLRRLGESIGVSEASALT
ncbi:TetR/AcrR family transcriptional regulator [Nocardia yunnanensis]|uniref:TetR/AcrR family transcriptional regulator n=1 Tax=Nocardia yunnanensis TaxID=2382165 RepID=A0A386ZLD4_9NOCA|nr:TetR/AcrR family transcriptional regulator [Nocardia yunnanensis]AYF77964.1 TetR/AcrR family transcriptional regulator [Nocardia yunnanensis]